MKKIFLFSVIALILVVVISGCTTPDDGQNCTAEWFDEYQCWGDCVMRNYQNTNCTFSWITEECCTYQCDDGACLSPPNGNGQTCDPEYLDNYTCSGDNSYVLREFQYLNCSTVWYNYEYCFYNCTDSACNIHCEDTDGGQAYYVSGTVEDNFGHFNDTCFVKNETWFQYANNCTADEQNCSVREAYCHSIDVIYNTTDYLCPEGCGDGACLNCTISWTEEYQCGAEDWNNRAYNYENCTQEWIDYEQCLIGCTDGECTS